MAKMFLNWRREEIERSYAAYKGEFFGDLVAEFLVRHLRKHIRPPILDVGAGSGALIQSLPEAIWIDLVERPEKMFAKMILLHCLLNPKHSKRFFALKFLSI